MKYRKAILVGLNASYSHTAYSLYALSRIPVDASVSIREYTINEPVDFIYRDLLQERADLYAFSCYLWNIEKILQIAEMIKIAEPNSVILFGGPEVSYDAEDWMQRYPFIDMILEGEGEAAWPLIFISNFTIPGLWQRSEDLIRKTPGMLLPDLVNLPPVYSRDSFSENKMYYYEASRGCPYQCSFCLSSIESLREVPLKQVEEELTVLAGAKVRVVKFIDRTMNANSARFQKVLDMVERLDNGITVFHMEIHPSALKESDIRRLKKLRKGLIQFEIGVQSTNPETCAAVRRVGETADIAKKIGDLREMNTIHLHLDLIAGLPYEGIREFRQSFLDVIRLNPHKLQIGFLKLLRGTRLRAQAPEYGIEYPSFAPYEVIKTKWLTAEELLRIKNIAYVVDHIYNEGWLNATLCYLHEGFSDSWDLFDSMAKWGIETDRFAKPIARNTWFDYCFEFGVRNGFRSDVLRDLLRYDILMRNPNPPQSKYFSFQVWKARDFLASKVQDVISDLHSEISYRETRGEHFSFDIPMYLKEGRIIEKDMMLLFVYENETGVFQL